MKLILMIILVSAVMENVPGAPVPDPGFKVSDNIHKIQFQHNCIFKALGSMVKPLAGAIGKCGKWIGPLAGGVALSEGVRSAMGDDEDDSDLKHLTAEIAGDFSPILNSIITTVKKNNKGLTGNNKFIVDNQAQIEEINKVGIKWYKTRLFFIRFRIKTYIRQK